MVLSYMPFSHSLLATMLFGALVAAVGRSRQGAFLGLAVWVAPVPPAAWVLALISQVSYLGFTALAWWTEPPASPAR